MEYFIRFAQYHETFRKPEIEALALLNNVKVEFVHYTENVSAQVYLELLFVDFDIFFSQLCKESYVLAVYACMIDQIF